MPICRWQHSHVPRKASYCAARRLRCWLSDGDLFIQSTSQGQTPTCNGAPVATSQWLHDGDVIRVGPARIAVTRKDGQTGLRVDRVDADNLTEPPRIVPVRDAVSPEDGDAAIKPVTFRPRAIGERSSGRRRIHPATPVVWVAILLLGAAAWYLFSLRSVEVLVDPEPDRLELVGTWPDLEFGGRHLVRPGRYRVVAEKAGLRATRRVGRGDR